MHVKTTLWKHQQAMHDFAVERFGAQSQRVTGAGWDDPSYLIRSGYAWWLAGCGTGKTLTTFKIAETMKAKKILVLTTKAAARSVWNSEAITHTEGLYVHDSTKAAKKGKIEALRTYRPDDNAFMYVVNYESAWRIDSYLKEFNFDLVIADEGHRLKAHNSQQSLRLAEVCHMIPYKLDMTGTGFSDRPTDVYGQVRWFQPIKSRGKMVSEVLGTWTKFFDRYTLYRRVDNIPMVYGYTKQEELREIINPFTMYVDSEEVLDLPEAVHIERSVPMTKKIRAAYKSMKDDFYAEVGDTNLIADSALEKILRLHQITSGYLPLPDGTAEPIVPHKENPKIQSCIDIIDELDDKPVVIFTRFIQDVQALTEVLTNLGKQVKQLTGAKQEHVEWQAGEGQILIANIQAGSEGVSLTRSRYCIYYSIGHSRTNYEQSLYRIRRKGADMAHPCTYYHLLMENSVDVQIRAAMQEKDDYSKYLLEGIR